MISNSVLIGPKSLIKLTSAVKKTENAWCNSYVKTVTNLWIRLSKKLRNSQTGADIIDIAEEKE